MSDKSIREQVILNVVETIRLSGQVRGVTDEEPFHYLKPDAPWCWVFEGDEVQDYQQLAGKVECDLTVCIHQTFRYVPGDAERDLYKLGRSKLADMQKLIMSDVRRGDWAWFTFERKNSIGRPAECEHPIGILATEWSVKYKRAYNDPFTK